MKLHFVEEHLSVKNFEDIEIADFAILQEKMAVGKHKFSKQLETEK